MPNFMVIAFRGKLHYHRLIRHQGRFLPSNFGECGELNDNPLQECTAVQAREIPVCQLCASKAVQAKFEARYPSTTTTTTTTTTTAPTIPHTGPCRCVRCSWKRQWRATRLKAGDKWSVGRDALRYAEEPGTYQWLTGIWSNYVWREWVRKPDRHCQPDHRELVRRAALNALSDAGQERLARMRGYYLPTPAE